MHGIDEIKSNNNFPLVNNNVRGNCCKYYKEMARRPQREHFFYNRTANVLNSLPSEIVNAQLVNGFKASLDRWMSSNQAQQLSQCA